jgi:hypothetical protein
MSQFYARREYVITIQHADFHITANLARLEAMFEDLQAKVDKIKSASDAAEALLVGLKAKLDEFLAGSHLTADDQAKLEAISASIGTEGEELAAAVVANTPSA